MRTLVTLAILLVIGFAGSRGIVARATHRLPLMGLFATGVEFLLLGMIAGPGGLDLITFDVLHSLEPIVYLALGWIGLLFGVELSVAEMRAVSPRIFRVLFIDAAVFGLLFAAILWLPTRYAWPGAPVAARIAGVAMFGVTASLTSPTIVALVARRLPARGPITALLKILASLNALFPLLIFGAVFMLVHPRFGVAEWSGVSVVWWVVGNAAALIMGLLMVLFTQERATDDEMLLVITGTVLLGGGLCYFFHVSALYSAMMMGLVVANASRRREHIFRELHVVEKPVFVALFVYVGAIIGLPSLPVLGVALVYVIVRTALKWIVTGSLVARTLDTARPCGSQIGLGLCGHGVMAVAVALDFALGGTLGALRGPLAVVAIAVLLDDGTGYALTRGLLIRRGEVVQRSQGHDGAQFDEAEG